MRRIYFDHSATTPTDKTIASAMLEYMTTKFGNPSSVHSFGREVRKEVRDARENIAALIHANENEIFFTSGGSESDNFALKGVAFANKNKGNHIITTQIEHHAVLHTCQWLEKQDFEVTYLPVDEDGMVRIEDLKAAITDKTILISVMFANNEVGTIEPIKEIGAIAKEHGIYFHTDAVQAVANVEIDVQEMHIDLLSLSGHKFYGPKGIGAIYIRRGVRIQPMQLGGAQERNMRAGTENVPAIVGLGMAAKIAKQDFVENNTHLLKLRDKLIQGIQERIPDIKLNGHPTKRLPGNVNFSFRYIEGESLLLNLDIKGIAASSGSACTSGSLDPSHVLLAMGLTHEIAHGSLRISLGRDNTEEDIAYTLEVLPQIIARLRSMSPLSAENSTGVMAKPCKTCYKK
ncbi:cysteine desulfurase NifS [Anaerosinus massiliensis]|uniref:cysteine desulfurase NifS n=1 Tax=Massilibacillus massiliensis TaxID=1806837 RepID=UPI000A4DAF16|nr:cysteine desulfurase NifS [Massilibacillus massiliensis]